jgi:hypothetical protein
MNITVMRSFSDIHRLDVRFDAHKAEADSDETQ